MKSKIFISLGIVMCITGTIIAAAGLEPGSSNDPLVTKSYVEQEIGKVKAGGAEFAVVPVEKGKTLTVNDTTELILRSGKAVINSYKAPDGTENGINDSTDGVDLKQGVNCPQNHLLIIPKNKKDNVPNPEDKRGITTTSDGVYIMVKGSYEIN